MPLTFKKVRIFKSIILILSGLLYSIPMQTMLLSIIRFLSSLATIATFCTAILLYMQIKQQQELFDITQKTQFQVIIREPCQSLELKYAALDALIKIDRGYKKNPDLRWAQLKDANLEGLDLINVNLSYADLSGTNLRGATMDGAIVKDAKYTFTTIFPEGFDESKKQKMKELIDQPKPSDCHK